MFTAVLKAFGYDVREYLEDFGGVTNEALAGLVGEEASARIGIDVPSEETKKVYSNAKERNKIRRFV